MKFAIAAACIALSVLSACASDDAGTYHGESQLDELIDTVLFFEALVMPAPTSQTQTANEVRS
ncbi:hypothetical protein LVB87_14525 [Lysobacter sp. KIS68-7]|uniref:hypothetical protein n=1 Tax=Lysobacter sp. KIS68-7 TaxID=2904252 RepID=UPI001E4EC89D|nr:hypothetical protein [Lysobacter sp. KIS68-7]UHQ19383.1 hypothetical protein LVB87_14525 [Lysobacter sp. KIS68-7]